MNVCTLSDDAWFMIMIISVVSIPAICTALYKSVKVYAEAKYGVIRAADEEDDDDD